MTVQQMPEASSQTSMAPARTVLLVVLGALLLGAVAGYLVGQRNPAMHSTEARCDSSEGSISCQPVDDSGNLDDDGWTYAVPLDVAWTGGGADHGGGRPACLPATGSGLSDVVRLAWVEVDVDGAGWRQVVSVSC
jgi:hypothetical protein